VRNILPQFSQGFSKFVGIPYEKKNCWDLAVDFYCEMLNIKLFHIYSGPTPSRADTSMLIQSNKGEFREVKDPHFGDLILIKVFGIESHIAVYLGGGKMLHTKKRVGSHLDNVDKWKNQIVGYYRVNNDKG
jgi:hypothetical protein